MCTHQATPVQAHMHMVDAGQYSVDDEFKGGMHCDQALPVQAEVHIVGKGECSVWNKLGLLQVLQCLCAQAESVDSLHCQCMRFSSLLLLLT